MKKDYNTFLIYGYTALITAIITWVTVHFTGRGEAMFTWFAMFIPYIANTFFRKSSKPEVTTYIDSMLGNIMESYREHVHIHGNRNCAHRSPHPCHELLDNDAAFAHLCRHRHIHDRACDKGEGLYLDTSRRIACRRIHAHGRLVPQFLEHPFRDVISCIHDHTGAYSQKQNQRIAI